MISVSQDTARYAILPACQGVIAGTTSKLLSMVQSIGPAYTTPIGYGGATMYPSVTVGILSFGGAYLKEAYLSGSAAFNISSEMAWTEAYARDVAISGFASIGLLGVYYKGSFKNIGMTNILLSNASGVYFKQLLADIVIKGGEGSSYY